MQEPFSRPEQLDLPPGNFYGWQRLTRARNNKEANSVVRREIQQFIRKNKPSEEFLPEDELFELGEYNSQAHSFFGQLYQKGVLNNDQRRVLSGFGVPPEIVPPPNIKVTEQEVSFFKSKESDPICLKEKISEDRSALISKRTLKNEERKIKETISSLFTGLSETETLERWEDILRFQFPWGKLPPKQMETLERQQERVQAFDLINALEVKRLGRKNKLSNTERLLANSAFYHLLRSNLSANIFQTNNDYATARGSDYYLSSLRQLYLHGQRTIKEIDTEIVRNFASAGLLFLLTGASLGIMDEGSFPGRLLQACLKMTSNPARVAEENRQFIGDLIKASPEIVRQAGNQATNYILDTFIGGSKFPYQPITEQASITPEQIAASKEKSKVQIKFREVGSPLIVDGENDGKFIGRFKVPIDTPDIIRFDNKDWQLDPTRVSQAGEIVWKLNNNYITVRNGTPVLLKDQKIQRYSFQPRVYSTSQTQAISENPIQTGANNNAFEKVPLPLIEVPATAPAIPDEFETVMPNGVHSIMNQHPDLDESQIGFFKFPHFQLYFEPEPGNIRSYFIYYLDNKNQLERVGYINATDGIIISNDKSVAIPNQPGSFFWKGTFLPGSKEYVLDVYNPLYLPPDPGKQIGSPAAILVQNLLAYPDKKNPGFYRVQENDNNHQTTITSTRYIQPSNAEMEALGLKIKQLIAAGRGWEAAAVSQNFEIAHTVSEKTDVSNRFFAPDGKYVGYGIGPDGKGPTHFVDYRPPKVIGEPGHTLIHIPKRGIISGTLLATTEITYDILDFIPSPLKSIQPQKFESSLPAAIFLDNGMVALPVDKQPGLYTTNDKTVFLRVTGTGDNVQIGVNTTAR